MWQSHSVDLHFLILFLKLSKVEDLLISLGITFHTFEVKKFSDFRPYLVVFVEGFIKSVCVSRLQSTDLRKDI